MDPGLRRDDMEWRVPGLRRDDIFRRADIGVIMSRGYGARGMTRQPARMAHQSWGGDGLRQLSQPAGDVLRGGNAARGAAVSVGQTGGSLSPAELGRGGPIG